MSAFHPYSNLMNGLVGAWCPSLSFSFGLIPDLSGNNKHIPKAPAHSFVGSLGGLALSTNGTSQITSFNAPAVIGDRDNTISMWVSPLVVSGSHTYLSFGDNVAGNGSRLAFLYQYSLSRLLVSTGSNTGEVYGGNVPVIGQWQCVTRVKQAGQLAVMYLNGRRLGTGGVQALSTLNTSVAPIKIAVDTIGANTGSVLLNDIRIYDRALTHVEIQLLASKRGIGLTPVRKRPPQLYPITTPPNRFLANSGGVWIPGTVKVNQNGYWANCQPSAATYHADAVDWEARVRANSGTVSVETLQAVSDFCTAIETAGIRSKLYRVSLFCGNNLQACLVPLYTSPTTGSAPVGGYAVDFNTGFLNSDYMEKGIGTGGLRGNGVAAKKLSTNLYPRDISTGAETGHLGIYTPPLRLYGTRVNRLDTPIGALNSTITNRYYLDWRGVGGQNGLTAAWGLNTTATQPTIFQVAGLILCDRSSTTRVDLYRQGVSVANNTAAQPTYTPSGAFEIFSNLLQNYTLNPIFGYTLGSSLTAAEHVAYSAAWNTFQAALSRSV